MQPERHVRLFRNGRNQALRIPRELELDADEAIVRKDGDRLIVEPVRRRPDLAALLAGWEPLDEILPDVDEGLLPLDEIRLQLEHAGTPIGPNDLLIAAHALASGLTLVTDNAEEFGRVAGLQVEKWLDSPASAP